MVKDEESGKSFYYNEKTQQSVWTRPSCLTNYNNNNGGGNSRNNNGSASAKKKMFSDEGGPNPYVELPTSAAPVSCGVLDPSFWFATGVQELRPRRLNR